MLAKPGRAALWSLLGAAVVYAWGAFIVFGVFDIEEMCRNHDQHWEFDPVHRPSLFPPSHPCHASYDLVPPYLTPVLFGLLASSAAFTAIAVVRRFRT